MLLGALYSRLPVWGQNVACSLYGRRLLAQRYGRGYERIKDEVFAREETSISGLREFQRQKLRAIVTYAGDRVPYYQRMFRELEITPRDIRELEDLRRVPVLSKQTVQDYLSEFVSVGSKSMRARNICTSGTTGTGLKFPITIEAERQQWATVWRYRKRFGIDGSKWYAHFFGRAIVPIRQNKPPFWRINRSGRQIVFSAYHMHERNLGHYVDELNRRCPEMIQGYPSLLTILAHYILTSGKGLEYVPGLVTTSSETLMDHQKSVIEQAFGTPCRQLYGQTEGIASISECPEGHLHVDEDLGYVEFLPVGDDRYSLVSTGFYNYAFPLIRYDLGDIVTLPSRYYEDPCGCLGRVVKSIDGRVEDYIVTPDGRKISTMNNVLKGVTTVKEAQLLQRMPCELAVNVVPGKGFGKSAEKRILDAIRERVGSELKLRIQCVESIDRTKSGKLRFVISELDAGRITRD